MCRCRFLSYAPVHSDTAYVYCRYMRLHDVVLIDLLFPDLQGDDIEISLGYPNLHRIASRPMDRIVSYCCRLGTVGMSFGSRMDLI
jgi:hypothetical protein